jgi:hypothetical protein
MLARVKLVPKACTVSNLPKVGLDSSRYWGPAIAMCAVELILTLGPTTDTAGGLQLLQVVRVTAGVGFVNLITLSDMASISTSWLASSTSVLPGAMVASLAKDTLNVVPEATQEAAFPSRPDVVTSNTLEQGKTASAARVLSATVMSLPVSASLALRMVRSVAVHSPKHGSVKMPWLAEQARRLQRVLALHSNPTSADQN